MNKIKKPFVVAFSGGCCSGKTTTLNALKEQLEKEGKKVLVFKADSHGYLAERATTIDSIRKVAFDYLRFQEWLCHEQGKFENEILQERYHMYDIILLDRSLFDCLFYTQYYMDLGSTSLQFGDGLNRYYDLLTYLYRNIEKSAKRIYDLTLVFAPITKLEKDVKTYTRPADLDTLKYIESLGICEIIKAYASEVSICKINLNKTPLKEVVSNVVETIKAT